MEAECVYCKKPVKDFEPQYCCNGYMCGCQGLPIEPPIHHECEIISLLKHIQKREEANTVSIGLSCKHKGEVILFNGRHILNGKDMTADEAFEIVGLFGNLKCLSTHIDFIIEKLKTIEK